MNAEPLLAPLAALLNRTLRAEPRAQALARRLEGRALRLVVTGTPLEIALAVHDGALRIATSGAADATITGTPLGLMALTTPDGTGRLRGDGLRIEGDAEVAQAFRELLEALRPDLEEELSRLFGDALAHHLARSARGALDFAARGFETLRMNVAEYLTE